MITFYSLFATLFMASVASANTGTGDPRCPADFDPMQRCPSSMILPGGAGLDPSRNFDSTNCNDQDNCPKCLDSPEWQTMLKDLVGLFTAKRDPTFKPWLAVGDWLSHEMVSTIAMILLRETMDIDARGAATNAFGNVEHICCSEPLLSMESWDTDTFLDDPQRTVAAATLGYTGQSGFFVPPYTVEKYPLAFTYHSYLLVDEYKHIFDRSFSTSCENMTVDSTLGCVDGNYICGNNEWTNTTCYEGKRYVPPQCDVPGEVGNPNTTNCQEVYLYSPIWEPGLLEGMIKNTGLNMTAAYLGDARFDEVINDAFAQKKDIMFYWWRPDPFVNLMDARQVQFDDATPECSDQYNSDPTLNTAKCGFPLLTLKKRTQTSTLAMDADFKHFFDTFSLSDAQLNKLMGQHVNGGGNSTVYNISCNWVRSNMDTWTSYVKNTPTIGSGTVSSSLITSPGVLAAVIVIPIIVLVIVGVFVAYLCFRHRASTRNAPMTAPLALIFTDIESSTMLWEAFGDEMGRAVEIHHAIIRNHIDEYGAYEVKTVGDSFMIACGSLADATLLCLAIQTSLGECTEFPNGLRFQRKMRMSSVTAGSFISKSSVVELDDGHSSEGISHITDHPTAAFREVGMPCSHDCLTNEDSLGPMRVRIALHWCHDVTARMDRIHGRYDYYGHDVNVCARVEGQAQGGQIMVTADTMKAITETDIYDLMIAPDATAVVFMRDVPLKGLSEPVTLYVLAPTSQITSGYIPTRLVPDSPRDVRRVSSFLTVRVMSQQSLADPTIVATKDDGNGLFRRVDSSQQQLTGAEKGEDCLSDQYTLTRTISGRGEDPLMTCSSPRAQHHFSHNTTQSTSNSDTMSKAALLRVAFKAVPDSGKMAWMITVAQDLSIALQLPDDVTDRSSESSLTRSAQRVLLFKIFEQIQIALGGSSNSLPGRTSEELVSPPLVMVRPIFSDLGSTSPRLEEQV